MSKKSFPVPFELPAEIFVQSKRPGEELIGLLERTELGTNGAQYRHLDTREKIGDAVDNPLFLSLELRGRLFGSMALCRRNETHYIRYVAVNALFRGSGKPGGNGSSRFRSALRAYLDGLAETSALYAYIEPHNARSRVMAETFGFKKHAALVSQTFSRSHPRKLAGLEIHSSWEQLEGYFREAFADHAFYFEAQLAKGPFAVWRGPEGIRALARIHEAHWEIKRFPGKFGGLLRRIVPYTPVLRNLICPASHRFAVVDSLVVFPGNEANTGRFLEGILHAKKTNMLMWWVDGNEPLYRRIQGRVRWGLIHRLSGAAQVDCLVKGKASAPAKPVYVNGGDLV